MRLSVLQAHLLNLPWLNRAGEALTHLGARRSITRTIRCKKKNKIKNKRARAFEVSPFYSCRTHPPPSPATGSTLQSSGEPCWIPPRGCQEAPGSLGVWVFPVRLARAPPPHSPPPHCCGSLPGHGKVQSVSRLGGAVARTENVREGDFRVSFNFNWVSVCDFTEKLGSFTVSQI